MGNNFQCCGNQIPAMEIKTIPPVCRAVTPLPALHSGRGQPAHIHYFWELCSPRGEGRGVPRVRVGPAQAARTAALPPRRNFLLLPPKAGLDGKASRSKIVGFPPGEKQS